MQSSVGMGRVAIAAFSLVAAFAFAATRTANSALADDLSVCALPSSTGALGNLVIPSTVTEPSNGFVFPTIAEINTNTGSITLAADTGGLPFVFYARTRIDTGVTNGIFNFGSVTVGLGAKLFVTGTNALVMLATGAVTIDGIVILDGRAGNSGGGGPGGCFIQPCGPPVNGGGGRSGGGDGGSTGFVTGESGNGASPGVGAEAGPAGGGGGGFQTGGLAGGTGPNIVPPPPIPQALVGGAAGPAVPLASLSVNLTATPLIFPANGAGGGGGGGDGAIYGDSGGDHGGGGGAGGGTLIVCAADDAVVNGSISAIGGAGGPSFGAVSGGGGGGSGGFVLLVAPSISGTGSITAVGGPGGFASGLGGNGGDGFIVFQANDLSAPPATNPPYVETTTCTKGIVVLPPSDDVPGHSINNRAKERNPFLDGSGRQNEEINPAGRPRGRL